MTPWYLKFSTFETFDETCVPRSAGEHARFRDGGEALPDEGRLGNGVHAHRRDPVVEVADVTERTATLDRLKQLLKGGGAADVSLSYSSYFESMSTRMKTNIVQIPALPDELTISKRRAEAVLHQLIAHSSPLVADFHHGMI